MVIWIYWYLKRQLRSLRTAHQGNKERKRRPKIKVEILRNGAFNERGHCSFSESERSKWVVWWANGAIDWVLKAEWPALESPSWLVQSRMYTLRLRIRLFSSSSSSNMVEKSTETARFRQSRAPPFCLLTIDQSQVKDFLIIRNSQHGIFLRDKLLVWVLVGATKLCNLQSDNVAREVARKCCPYYFALMRSSLD